MLTNLEMTYFNSKRKKSTCNTEIKINSENIIKVNRISPEKYFIYYKKKDIEDIFKLCDLNMENFSIVSQVKGGGIKAQYDSFLLSLSKSVLNFIKDDNSKYENSKKILRKKDLVTSDHRQKQSKTPGKVKARKTRQFSKR